MGMREEHLRNRELTLDFLTGVKIAELTEKYQLSKTRCHQIIRRTIFIANPKLYNSMIESADKRPQKNNGPYTLRSKAFLDMKFHLIPLVANRK